MNRQEIEKTVFDFLTTKGLPDISAASVMGNIEAESEFDPSLIEEGNSIGFGLCQWSFERRNQLESYGTSLDHQLNFLWSELTGENLSTTHADYQWNNKTGYLTIDQFRAGQGSLEELTKAFCFCFERPNEELAHIDRRINSAITYYNTYNGKGEIYNPSNPTGDKYILDNAIEYNSTELFPVPIIPRLKDTFEIVEEKGDRVKVKSSSGLLYETYKKHLKKIN